MSRFGDNPSSNGSSGLGGGDRWDTARFTKERDARHEPSPRRQRRGVEVAERDGPDTKAPLSVEDYLRSRRAHGPPARRADELFNDDNVVSTAGAMIPYGKSRGIEDEDFPQPRRPTLLRRQSSLDTFDRAASRRVHDYRRYDRDDYGPPITPEAVPRRHSPPRYSKPDLDEIRVAEPDYYGDEEFRNMRERSSTPRGRRHSSLREGVIREKFERPVPRRGKTRIPKRLVHVHALEDLGYPFIEEGGTILVHRALAKENIDELITLSDEIKRHSRAPREYREKEKEKVKIGTRQESMSVERHRSKSRRRPTINAPPAEVVELRDRSRRYSRSPSTSLRPPPTRRPRRRSSPIPIIEPRDAVYEDVIEPRSDMALLMPDRIRRSDREIRAEIRALEDERRGIRTSAPIPDEVEVKRDHKAPSPRLIRAMMATLT